MFFAPIAAVGYAVWREEHQNATRYTAQIWSFAVKSLAHPCSFGLASSTVADCMQEAHVSETVCVYAGRDLYQA